MDSDKSPEDDGYYRGGRDGGTQLVPGIMDKDQPKEKAGQDGGIRVDPGVMDSDQSNELGEEIARMSEWFVANWLRDCERCGYVEKIFWTELLEKGGRSCGNCGESRKVVCSSRLSDIQCCTCGENVKLAITDRIGGWDEERGALFGPEALKCLSAVGNSSQDQELLQKLGICQELRLSLLNLKSKEVPGGLTLCQSLVNLDMSCNELTSIPDGIFSLSHLESLNLSLNRLTEIPSDIKALAELKDVNLSHNQKLRDITSVCQCIKLRRLVVHDNQLVNIPVEIVNIIELEEIDLSNNHIRDFDSLVTCAKLRKVLLWVNKLGIIPAEVGKLSELEEIDLSNNQIRDFDSLVTCAKLRKVLLRGNKLRSIPAEVGKLSELEEIDLSCNKIRDFDSLVTCAKLRKVSLHSNTLASIPAEVGKLSELEEIDLSNNQIRDFDSLVTCAKLRKVLLRGNKLGSIPAEVGKLSELEEIDLSNNQIRDFDSLVTCAKLRKVLLQGNKLGSIPAEVGKLSELEEIDLSNNQIRDFDSQVTCAKVRKVLLRGNKLRSIPAEVGKLSELDEIDLSCNKIRDFDSLVTFAKVRKVSLHHNKLASIPAEVGKLSELEEIDLSDNQIRDFDSLVTCAKLRKVLLWGNKLGSIAAEVGKLSELEDIDLSDNQIREFDSLVICAKLRKVLLQGNKLGSIPAEVGKLSELEEIDLSDNQIRDFDSLVTCAKLRKVLLRGNKLGSIPAEVGKLSELEEIDLSDNQISDFDSLVTCAKLRKVLLRVNNLGSIPAEAGKLSELEEINLSDNHIRKFDSLVTCAKLREVILSCNLIKVIPPSIGNMKQLENLDLSNDEMRGFPRLPYNFLDETDDTCNDICSLPDEVCQLKKLRFLDLQNNSLHQLPIHIDHCDSLQLLCLDGNPLTRPPLEVCESGVKAIFQYFMDLRQSESRVRKQQVVFLGETGAGKTSLARTLVNNQSSLADPADRTRVLDRYVLKVSNDLQLQITDFGGHHVYELAHTFFLTSEVIASLVVDLSRYDDDNYMNFAGRWLGTLMAMSWKSTVIVVGTHSDCCAEEEIERKKKDLLGRIKDQHRRMISDVEAQRGRIILTMNQYDDKTKFHGYVRYLEDIRKSKERHLESLRSNFNLIDDIFVTSSHSLHGIPEFKSQLLTVCDKKAATLPGLWLAIQDIMDGQSDEPCIELEKFYEIVRRGFTVRELPTDDIQHTAAVLLSYQHQCGNYLWFEDDEQLKAHIFHRPDFVVEFLKGIFHHNMDSQLDQSNQDFDFTTFTNKGFKKAKEDFLKCGLISTDLLRCLLKRHVSVESLFDTLLHLLEKFCLCFPVRKIDHGSILCFPWFLANDQPDEMKVKWPKKPSKHQYQIEFHFSRQCPEAFFELAIVRVHQCFGPFLRDVVTWKNGVYFHKGHDKIRMSKVCVNDDVILRLAVRGEQVTKSLWPSLMKAYHAVVGLLVSKWPGASYDIFYVCPHCLCCEVAEPTLYPAHDLQNFLFGEEFLPCDNSDEGVLKVDEVVPGSFSVPTEGQLFEAQKGFDICQRKVKKCSSAEGGTIPGSSNIASTSTSHAVSSSNPSLLGKRKSAIDDAEAGIIPPKIPEGLASTSTDPSMDTATPARRMYGPARQAGKDTLSGRFQNCLTKAYSSVAKVTWSDGKSGSGFRVGTRYLMTNYHVVQEPPATTPAEVSHRQTLRYCLFNFDRAYEPGDETNFRILQFTDYPVVAHDPELDYAILELAVDPGTLVPEPLTLFKKIVGHEMIYFAGHPSGQAKLVDPGCKVVRKTEAEHREAVNWSLTNLGVDAFPRFLDPRRVLYHVSEKLIGGSSGCPGLVSDGRDNACVAVVNTFQFPDVPQHLLAAVHIPDKYIVEQGVRIEAIYRDLHDQNPLLCDDIFPHGMPT